MAGLPRLFQREYCLYCGESHAGVTCWDLLVYSSGSVRWSVETLGESEKWKERQTLSSHPLQSFIIFLPLADLYIYIHREYSTLKVKRVIGLKTRQKKDVFEGK